MIAVTALRPVGHTAGRGQQKPLTVTLNIPKARESAIEKGRKKGKKKKKGRKIRIE